MVQAGMGLDTPRTNLGDATYLTNPQLDFDISAEQSFQSPSNDNNNLLTQLQNGRRGISLKTPRSRVALNDRKNLPLGLGGGEFTPLLKSATRNSAMRNGKENIPATPAFGGLGNIPEDLTPLPAGSSVYGGSRNGSYMNGTPMPMMDSSSTASTPMALLPRKNDGPGLLQEGNPLSLREQENAIDRIEKENFGLKLKIHFLEEALKKAGPGYSEAALRENTELKVDKVTMQRDLLRYKKTLTAAERDMELYKQQFAEMQERMRRKSADAGQKEELERLRRELEDRDAEINLLKSRESQYDDLQDKVQDLEAEVREKNRLIDDKDDDIENLKDDMEKQANTITELEIAIKNAQRKNLELEEKAQVGEELEDAKETIEELEAELERAKKDVQEAQEDRDEALREKEHAESNLEELQEEMANKSITTKGLSRQIEEKANRLQDDLEDLREKHGALEEQHADKLREVKRLEETIDAIQQQVEVREQKLQDKLDLANNEKTTLIREKESIVKRFETVQRDHQQKAGEKDSLASQLGSIQTQLQQKTNQAKIISQRLEVAQRELQQKAEEKHLLQTRHDALTTESLELQRELSNSRNLVEDLEDKLNHEKTLALESEQQIRQEYKEGIDRLHDEVEDLRAELREKDRQTESDADGWDSERRSLESQKSMAEEKAAGLQRTIDRLQEAEGNLSSKESKLQQALQAQKEQHESQQAVLTRQITELNEEILTRRKAVEDVRSELINVREELRQSQREQRSLAEKAEGLEDEVEILQTSLDDESEQAHREITAAKQDAESLRRQLQTLKQDLARAEAATADAQALVNAFQGDLKADEGSKEQLSSRLRDVENQLSRVRQEKQDLQSQLSKTNVEVNALRASKADIEAERDEIKTHLTGWKQQEEATFRLDQERMDLRAAKLKLDGEVRRLREENKLATSRSQTLEDELQQEIDRAGNEEARLTTEIHDLQKLLRGSSEKRELAAAKKTIQQLEDRIHELEAQVLSGEGHADAAIELSTLRHDLATARQKETEYLQRESAQKDFVRGLKRQITELERKVHEAEISRFVSSSSSPPSSIGGSARKSELIEVRSQLASAHQTLKELRSQVRDVEKEAAKKVNAVNLQLQSEQQIWENEKYDLERSLDEAQLAKEELITKNTASESTISRLRSKIDRLEKALKEERANIGEERTIVQERRDLHEMLRETQVQVESLELVVEERDKTIATISAAEANLRFQLKRVREERSSWRTKATSDHEALEHLERKYRRSKEVFEKERIQMKEEWEEERKALTKGVRFANMSVSEVGDVEGRVGEVERVMEEKEETHRKEMRGMLMQIEWLRARVKREERLRNDAAYVKTYMALQIELFEACNKADISLLHNKIGIPLPAPKPKKPHTIKRITHLILFTIRIRKSAAEWREKRKIDEKIREKVKEQELKKLMEGRKREVVRGLVERGELVVGGEGGLILGPAGLNLLRSSSAGPVSFTGRSSSLGGLGSRGLGSGRVIEEGVKTNGEITRSERRRSAAIASVSATPARVTSSAVDLLRTASGNARSSRRSSERRSVGATPGRRSGE